MIDFRYHIVSIVAVFLALALGLVIGSTTLRPKVAQDLKNRTDQVTQTNRDLSAQKNDLQQQLNDANAFDSAVTSYAVKGRLSGHTVVVVSAPGADNGQRERIEAALTEAGASVNGDVRLRDALVDPAQDAFLASLASRVAPPNRALPDASGVNRALALLADVLGARPQGPTVSASAAAKVISAYSAGHLISVSGSVIPRAGSLVVLLAGPPPETTASPSPSSTPVEPSLAAFAGYLDDVAVGAVVVGPTDAASDGGLLATVRDDKALRNAVSTVDGTELPRGVVTTVLALAEQADGGAGSYGSKQAGASDPAPADSPGSS